MAPIFLVDKKRLTRFMPTATYWYQARPRRTVHNGKRESSRRAEELCPPRLRAQSAGNRDLSAPTIPERLLHFLIFSTEVVVVGLNILSPCGVVIHRTPVLNAAEAHEGIVLVGNLLELSTVNGCAEL